MNKGGFSIDFKEFNEKFRKIVEDAIPEEAGRGLFKAGNELLRDAIKVQPYAPFKEGHLRAAARVEEAKVEKGEISVQAGFNIEYAARWHEIEPTKAARINWSLPGSGPKYLESKMAMFMKKYMEIVAEHIRRVAGK